MKKNYCAPEVMITYIEADIITYSETGGVDGPLVPADEEGEN